MKDIHYQVIKELQRVSPYGYTTTDSSKTRIDVAQRLYELSSSIPAPNKS